VTQHTARSSSWTQTEVGNGVALSTELGQFGADDRDGRFDWPGDTP
jgi:hypothetical protein